MHTFYGTTLPKGYLEFYTGTRFFGENTFGSSGGGAFTLWNVQGFSSLNYGISDHFELTVSPVFYQDTNSDRGNALDGAANMPDDLYLGLKLGSYATADKSLNFGGFVFTRLPTAEEHNILYEPYSAGRMELGLTGFLSYYSNDIFPEEYWSVHVNLGYLNHNDVGKEIQFRGESRTSSTDVMSTEILLSAGVRIPAGTFDFSFELFARQFLSRPSEAANTRGYVSYLTPGVYYKPYPWLTLEMGVDVRLFYDEEMAVYPEWRGVLGAKIGLLPTSLFKSEVRSLLDQREAERREILERMMREQGETQEADDELARIRAERKRIEEELRRLRKLLDEEKDKKKKGNEG